MKRVGKILLLMSIIGLLFAILPSFYVNADEINPLDDFDYRTING